jgi:hypothetical protein
MDTSIFLARIIGPLFAIVGIGVLPNTKHGVVTLSQIERRLLTTANAEARDFNDLACWSIA